MRTCPLRPDQRREYIHVEQATPVFDRKPGRFVLSAQVQPRVVNEYIDPAQALDDRVDRQRGILFRSDIRSQRDGRPPLRFDSSDRLACTGFIEIDDRNRRTPVCHRLGVGPSDARRRPGHDRDPTRKIMHV
jgi:hypothetical protein